MSRWRLRVCWISTSGRCREGVVPLTERAGAGKWGGRGEVGAGYRHGGGEPAGTSSRRFETSLSIPFATCTTGAASRQISTEWRPRWLSGVLYAAPSHYAMHRNPQPVPTCEFTEDLPASLFAPLLPRSPGLLPRSRHLPWSQNFSRACKTRTVARPSTMQPGAHQSGCEILADSVTALQV